MGKSGSPDPPKRKRGRPRKSESGVPDLPVRPDGPGLPPELVRSGPRVRSIPKGIYKVPGRSPDEPTALEMEIYHYRVCGYTTQDIVNHKKLAPGCSTVYVNKTLRKVEGWLRDQRSAELVSGHERQTVLLEQLLRFCIERFKMSCEDVIETIESFDSDGNLNGRQVRRSPRNGDPAWIKLTLSISDRLRELWVGATSDDGELFPSGLGRKRFDTIRDFYGRIKKRIELEEENTKKRETETGSGNGQESPKSSG
jgi:hypothetical protein